jgi:cell division septation protein DedD
MSHNDAEKELILGNKQLISLFFVVVALCGVVFAMGYMIGKNSTKPTSVLLDPASAGSEGEKRKQPEARREEAAQTDPAAASTTEPAPIQPQPAQAPPETSTTALPPSPPPVSVPVESPKTKPAGEIPPREYKAAAKSEPGVALGVPAEGSSYWQIVAYSKKADADGVVRTMRDARFPTLLYKTPDNLYHVLVGPYLPGVPLSEAKTKLKTVGFGAPILKKY